MKLLSCEYKGETFAAVSDGKKAYKAAPDMYALLDRLEGACPDRSSSRARASTLASCVCLRPSRSLGRT